MGEDEIGTIRTLPAYYAFFLGLAYRGIGRYEEALKAYQKALPQFPDTSVGQLTVPFKNQSDIEHHRDELRKAGLN
jgi:tetratricopeptide (TPR) repeat protein